MGIPVTRVSLFPSLLFVLPQETQKGGRTLFSFSHATYSTFFAPWTLHWCLSHNYRQNKYTGYFIQLLCNRIVIEAGDAAYLVSAFSAALPWTALLSSLYFGKHRFISNPLSCLSLSLFLSRTPSRTKNSNTSTEEFKRALLPLNCGNIPFCSVFPICMIILVFFGAFSGMFDWADSGFWSPTGNSQLFSGFITISYFLQSLWMFYMARNVDHLQGGRTSIEYAGIETVERV